MFKHLRNNFLQAFGGTLLWVIILVTLFSNQKSIPTSYLWNIVGVALIFSVVFGVLYTYLWEYSVSKAAVKIIISSAFNVIGGLCGLYLFSQSMFSYVVPYVPYIIIITLVGHYIGFYIYSKLENQKLAREINKTLKTNE